MGWAHVQGSGSESTAPWLCLTARAHPLGLLFCTLHQTKGTAHASTHVSQSHALLPLHPAALLPLTAPTSFTQAKPLASVTWAWKRLSMEHATL